MAAAQRESLEEAGIVARYGICLDSVASIPRDAIPGAPWPASVYVVPEYCFAVEVPRGNLRLSHEQDRYEWLDYEQARERLTWDSNRVAFWELRERVGRDG